MHEPLLGSVGRGRLLTVLAEECVRAPWDASILPNNSRSSTPPPWRRNWGARGSLPEQTNRTFCTNSSLDCAVA